MDLRPQLERLDRLVLRSEGLDPDALTFAFRPLWQLDAQSKAGVALAKAQASAVYAGLGLWPAATVARLVEAQVAADGVYPNAEAVFAAARAAPAPAPGAAPTRDFDPNQPRAPDGRWTAGGGGTAASVSSAPAISSSAGEGAHAPDGTLVEGAAFKGRGRHLARAVEVLLGGVGRVLRRWWPEGSKRSASASASSQPAALPFTIRFGRNANQSYHAYRHIDEAGLDRTRVENAVRDDLISRMKNIQDGLNRGNVIVDGHTLDYNAYKFPSGEINVGRITLSK